MGEDYRKMWKDLGLDLGMHEPLLQALSKGYQDNYLAHGLR
jgi:hypothetical protein